MQIELDDLELATIKSALDFFDECMNADEERRGPKFLPFQCVDENIGCLTSEERQELIQRMERLGK
jgi:hypothetical protein